VYDPNRLNGCAALCSVIAQEGRGSYYYVKHDRSLCGLRVDASSLLGLPQTLRHISATASVGASLRWPRMCESS